MIIKSYDSKILVNGYDVVHPFINEYIPSVSIIPSTNSTINVPINHLEGLEYEVILNVNSQLKKTLDKTSNISLENISNKNVYDADLQNDCNVIFNYPAANIFSSDNIEIIAVAEYMLERAREEKHTYCIHSSSVECDGKGVVLFSGFTDMGKTAVAFELANNGHKFISDEKTLLKDSNIVGGISFVNLRKLWQNKYGTGVKTSKELFKNISSNNNIPIAFFVVPYIDNGYSFVERWNEEKFFWHIQEELSRKIRGASRVLNNQTELAPSLDSLILSKQRIKYARDIAKDIPCYSIRGTPEQIAKKIIDLI